MYQNGDSSANQDVAADTKNNTNLDGAANHSTAPMHLDQQWNHVTQLLKNEIGEAAYKNWIIPLMVKDLKNGQLEIAVPTRFMATWVRTHYAEMIRQLWSGEFDEIQSVEMIIISSTDPAPQKDAETASHAPSPAKSDATNVSDAIATPKTAANKPSSETGFTLDNQFSSLDPRFTFDNFVVGAPNELAHAAARRVAENAEVSFNPLFLYGGVGLGKTHLMHAIAWAIKEKSPERKVMYMSAEKFMYQFIRALRFKDTMAFKEQFRSVDVLMIDDVQFISGKESTQEEFFHTFNALVDQNRQIIISADKSPSDLEGMEERLRSRLGWGLVADIHPTTYELRLGILEAKCEHLNQEVPSEVLEFLAHKITSNIRELEGALNRIAAHSDLIGCPITLASTQSVLQDLLRANDRRVTIEDIQQRVAEHYNIKIADMHAAKRARNIARPRQVAMYLCKQLTQYSLPEIGRKFGGRDHTTVMHGIRRIDELLQSDKSLSEDVDILTRSLKA